MLEAIGLGASGKEEELYAALLGKLGGKDPRRWSPKLEELAWRLHPVGALGAFAARLADPKLAEGDKRRALVALAFIPHRDAAGAVLEVAERGSEPLKSYALALAFDRSAGEWRAFGVAERLAALRPPKKDDQRLASWKRAVLAEGPANEERRKAIETLALDKEGGSFVIGLAAQGKLAPELKQAAAEVIFRNPDPGVRGLASQHFQRPSFEGAAFPALAELLKMKGSASRGREVFFSPQAACAQCHEYDGKGRSIGPALTTIGGKMGREAIFDSVLNPSAGIAFGYEPWVVTTKDQQTVTGFILGDGENVLIRDVAGEHRMIPAKEIAHREKQKTSIMPDNIALGMKPQELVDLVEFLVAKP
jgi:putative heme-binding domain-containing protein